MKLAKSLLLGSVAGFAAVATAQAADLPVRVKNPEYVRICNTYGAGFFFIPGTDTCLQVGGRIRAEVRYQDRDNDFDEGDKVGWRTRAHINLDARTATEYGTLRTFIRLQTTHNSGTPYNDKWTESQADVELDRGFIQFAGLTAGRSVSFFDFSEGTNYGTLRFSDGVNVNLLAYTATFGNGISATLAIEDPANRRVAEYTIANYSIANNIVTYGYSAPEGSGTEVPDIVGALRIDQSWGSAQLSAAAHQINGTEAGNFVNNAGFTTEIDDEWGFAVGLGVKLNLDMLAPGDFFWANATYTSGALGYMGFDNNGNKGRASNSRLASAIAHQYTANGDFDTDLADGWQVSAGFEHYWTPTFRSSLFGSYAVVDSIDVTKFGGQEGFSVTPELKEYIIGAQAVWSPVRKLDIGLEVLYSNAEYEYNGWAVDAAGVRTAGGWTDEIKTWETRLRIQRDF